MTRKRFIKKLMALQVRPYDAKTLARLRPKGMSYSVYFEELRWLFKSKVAEKTKETFAAYANAAPPDYEHCVRIDNSGYVLSYNDPIYTPAPDNAGYWRES